MKGNAITATFVRTSGDVVELRSDKGRPLRVHRDNLSDADWLYLATLNPEFLDIAIDVGVISRAQRPKISEHGYITPHLKFHDLAFRLDRRNNLTLELADESWRVPLTADFWEICDHLSPFANDEYAFASSVMWETDKQYYGSGGRREEKERVLLRIRLTDDDTSSWWRGEEGKDVVTILIDERGLDDLRAMPQRTVKAQESLRNNPRLRRVHELLAKTVEADKQTFSLANIQKSTDPMEGATFYRNQRDCSLQLPNGANVTLFPYIGQTREAVNLKFKLIYTAMDWLFIKKVILLSESGHRAVIDVASRRDSKVVDGGGIAEWSDVILKPDEVAAFMNATSIKCRLEGQFRQDFDLTTDQLMTMREVLSMYDTLTGRDTGTQEAANNSVQATK